MINRETAKQFLETRGYPNPECDYENELLDTMVEYAQQQAKNNEDLDLVSNSLEDTSNKLIEMYKENTLRAIKNENWSEAFQNEIRVDVLNHLMLLHKHNDC